MNYATNTLKVNGLELTKNGFNYKGRNYSYGEVNGLYFICQKTKYSGISTSNTVGMTIRVNDGTQIKITNCGLCLVDPREKIKQAYEILRKITYNQRYSYYVNQLKNNGFIEYKYSSFLANTIIPTFPTVKIYPNGNIEYWKGTLNLKKAKEHGMLLFGTHWQDAFARNNTYSPYEIAISEKSTRLKVRMLRINALWDTDIIHSIIERLSEGDSL